MKKTLRIFMLLWGGAAAIGLSAAGTDGFTFSGSISDADTGEPVEFAVVQLVRTEQWAVADEKGRFTIRNVQPGQNIVSVSCLGYVTDTREIAVSRNIGGYRIRLKPDNLALESVVVTAKENENSATTARTIDRTALDHIQMVNVADVASLLPGGVTSNPTLVGAQRFSIRSGAPAERGNASFCTAVEVDGVRLSNNASFDNPAYGIEGVTTNNIASANVKSVEVITGVPSVEYGDMTSGIIKVHTFQGKTPCIISMSANPTTRQLSFSKGFSLGRRGRDGRASAGVLNAGAEYTRSVGDLMSPYSAYDRKQLSLTYSNLFNRGPLSATPLRLSLGLTGNLGGTDNRADPDLFTDTFLRKRDDALRGHLDLSWLLSRKWITNVELKASVSGGDRSLREKKRYGSSSGTVALHGTQEGYFVAQPRPDAPAVLIPRGYWYNVMRDEDRPFSFRLGVKANWARQFGKLNNRVRAGADWSGDHNYGRGEYSEDLAGAPTFREYRYDRVPFMHNLAAFLEDNLTLPIGTTRLNLIAGVRTDRSFIRGSVYGAVGGLSPRFNAKYTLVSPKGRSRRLLRELSLRAGWGVAAKQPSFSILYPRPSYYDLLTFAPTSGTDAASFYAYYTLPRTVEYNPALVLQRGRMAEAGIEADLGGHRLSLAAYYTRTTASYVMEKEYERFRYRWTDATGLEAACTIAVDDRRFEVNPATGVVTVHDRTGRQAPQELPYKTMERFNPKTVAANSASPVERYGVEWTVDFRKIRPLNTTVRLDGAYYAYRSVDTDRKQYCPTSSLMSDGRPYRYVAVAAGGDRLANGEKSGRLTTNLSVTTHIPAVRIVATLRIETTLFSCRRALSEYADGSERSRVVSDLSDLLSVQEGVSIYEGKNYTLFYPETYFSYEAPDTPRPFLPDLQRAKETDPTLFHDLGRLVTASYYTYIFRKDRLTPFYSANFSVTKEIGDRVSLSFYANNFFNQRGQVYSTKTETYGSMRTYVPRFYYGLSLRLKI